jgi:predicted nucleic acid-binding protein
VGTLIDTSVLIQLERGGADVPSRIRVSGDDAVFLSVVTASELLHGVWRAKDEGMRARRIALVEAILREFPLVDVDLAVARVHAQVWAEQQARGSMIGAHDLWIAATCIAHGFRIATVNVRDFERIPGLQVQRW